MSTYHNVVAENYDEKMKELLQQVSANRGMHTMSFYLLANNAFEWSGLPKETLKFLPEEFLIYWGRFAYFKEGENMMLLPCYPAGALKENGEYTQYVCIAKNGKNYRKNYEDIEICFGNSMKLPTYAFICEWAEKCGYALSTVDSMLERAMYPDIVACKDKASLDAISETLDKQKNLVPFRAMNTEGFGDSVPQRLTMFDNREKDVLSLWETYQKYKSNFLNYYGIFTVGINKNERLTESESKGNQDSVRYQMYADMYMNRLDFIERAKAHFGDTGISVKKNRSIAVTDEEMKAEAMMSHMYGSFENKEDKGVKEDGETGD